MQDLKFHAIMINDWAFFLREFKMRRINHHRIKMELPLVDEKYDLCWDRDTRFTALITNQALEEPVEIQVNDNCSLNLTTNCVDGISTSGRS